MTTPSKWKHLQQRTGWPFGPWWTAAIVIGGFALIVLVMVGISEAMIAHAADEAMQGVQ